MKSFPVILRQLRCSRGLSQTALAQAIGVSKNHIAGLEHGKWEPTTNMLRMIAKILGVKIDTLVGMSGRQSPISARKSLKSRPRKGKLDLQQLKDFIEGTCTGQKVFEGVYSLEQFAKDCESMDRPITGDSVELLDCLQDLLDMNWQLLDAMTLVPKRS